jgi:hypothetical protein
LLAGSGNKGAKGAAPATELPAFDILPTSMALAVEEVQELSVFAFPKQEGLVEDVIMCRCDAQGGLSARVTWRSTWCSHTCTTSDWAGLLYAAALAASRRLGRTWL